MKNLDLTWKWRCHFSPWPHAPHNGFNDTGHNFSLPYLLTATNKLFLPKVLFNHDWGWVVGSFRNPYKKTSSKRGRIYLLRHMSCMEFSQIRMSSLKMAQIKSSCRRFLQNIVHKLVFRGMLGRDKLLLSTQGMQLWAQIKWWISTLWPNIRPMRSVFPSPLLSSKFSATLKRQGLTPFPFRFAVMWVSISCYMSTL